MKTEPGQKLSEEYFEGRAVDLAEDLIGKLLVRETEDGLVGGYIVETEAYLGRFDPSCHFAKSGKARKKVFRKGAGTVYVYKIHGHDCMNFISEYEGEPEGILIRALKPLEGIEKMKEHRDREKETELCSGPGKLTEALNISKDGHNGQKISESPVSVFETGREHETAKSCRIGIKKAKRCPLRFTVRGSNFVSQPLDRNVDGDFSREEIYSKFSEK